jgi:hypothetical protein
MCPLISEQILKIVDQWIQGKIMLCFLKNDPRLQARYNNLKSSLLLKLAQFQANHNDKWEVFLHNVRKPQLTMSIYVDLSELPEIHVL